jgi:acetyl esterase/lipase
MLLSVADAPFAFRCHTGIEYGIAPDMPNAWLHLDLLVPEPVTSARPAVIYIHGGGWETGQRGHAMYPWINPLLAAHGFVTASITYRLSDTAAFPAQIHDAKAAVRWLRGNARRYNIDPDRIGAWGNSAGGHLAALLGVTAGVAELEGACGTPNESSALQAVVARAAPMNFIDEPASPHPDWGRVTGKLFAGSPDYAEHWKRMASPLLFAGPDMPPFLLVHGTADEVVPNRQAQQMAKALRAHECNVTLQSIEGAHHNMRAEAGTPAADDVMDTLGRQALAFFTQHLNA